MGIDTEAAIWVGRQRKEFDAEKLESWLDSDELHTCPPHFDGYGADWAVVGFRVLASGSYAPTELVINEGEIERLKDDFKNLTGMDAKVYLSPLVW